MKTFFQRTKDAGFTLVEIMVVVGILGILFAIATPIFLEAQKQAQIGTLHSDISSTAIDTATRANSNFGNEVPITGEEFNSYKAQSAGNTLSLVLYTKLNGKIEYCIEGVHAFSDTEKAYLSYNLTTKEYKDTTCSYSGK